LPAYTKKKGPEIFRKKDTASFLSNRKSKPLATWMDREMRIAMLIERKATDARKFTESLLLDHDQNSGISKDLIAKNKLQIYSGSDRKIEGLAEKAIEEIISTERLIFR
jgi:hypothetical protein